MTEEVIEKKTILEESIKKFKGVRGGLTVLGINDIDDLREIDGESKEGVALKMDDLPETITGVKIMTEEVIEKVAEIISRGRHIDTVYVKPFDNENKIYEAMRKPWKKLAIKVLLKLESLGYFQKDPEWKDKPDSEGWWWYGKAEHIEIVYVAKPDDGNMRYATAQTWSRDDIKYILKMHGKWSKAIVPRSKEC
jgi:hypothetical protein